MKALFEVFYQPGKLFASLPERKGAWIAPMIAVTLLVLVGTYLVPQYVGRENVARQQLEGASARMRPEQMRALIKAANSPAAIYKGYASAIVGTALMLLIISGALMAFALMTSRAPAFPTVLSMVSLAMFPYWLVTTALTAWVLITAPHPGGLDVQNLLATNIAAYMDKNSIPRGLNGLFSSLDVLSFGEIGLLSYGFSKIARTRFFYGLLAVGGLWILYVSAKTASSLLYAGGL
jgi:hypothetical protein